MSDPGEILYNGRLYVPTYTAEEFEKADMTDLAELEGALREGIKAVRDGRGDATKTYMKVVDWANKYEILSGEGE